MGEPVDKNLWGELEPEEGMFWEMTITSNHITNPPILLQRKRRNLKKNRKTKRTKTPPLLLQMDFKHRQALPRPQA